jgi:MYXO-CTERM domain-containing protein
MRVFGITLDPRPLAAAAALLAGAAQAGPTTLTFTGSVSTVDAALTGTFHPGDAVSIVLSYDPAAQDLIPPNPTNAGYPYLAFDLMFGGYSASFGTQFPNGVGVLNDTDQGLGPADAFGASGFQTGAGAPVGGLPLQQGFVTLWDFTQTAFSGTSLPAAPSFGAFSYRVGGLTFCSNPGCGVGSNMSSVFADISAMSVVTSVPEPPSAALVLLSVVAIVALRVRRRAA